MSVAIYDSEPIQIIQETDGIRFVYDGKYEYPKWSYEGFIERYGQEDGKRLFEAMIDRIINGPPDYEAYLKSERWRERASEAKRRAGHRCQICSSPDRLDAHHRTYERLGHETDSDITVLCRDCHELFSKNGRLHK